MIAINSFTWPKWKQTNTLLDALMYMIIKGIEERLPIKNPPPPSPGKITWSSACLYSDIHALRYHY